VNRSPKLKTIAIIRLSSLGDIVHTLPAFQLLRRRFPAARISWFVEPGGARLLRNFSGIDDIVVVDLKGRSLAGRIGSLRELLRQHRGHFDLVLDFQGLIKSALLALLLGGERLGFRRGNLREPLAACCYHRTAPLFSEQQPVILKNIHLLSLLGIEGREVAYPLRPLQPSRQLTKLWTRLGRAAKGLVILNVGGGWPTKRLSATQWLDVIAALGGEYPLLILWGTPQERMVAERISRRSGVELAPELDFSDLIMLIRRAALLVSGDTLALHLADVVGTLSLGIFGPTAPERNGSLLAGSAHLQRIMACSFCYRRTCDTMDCLRKLSVTEIVAAIRSVHAKY